MVRGRGDLGIGSTFSCSGILLGKRRRGNYLSRGKSSCMERKLKRSSRSTRKNCFAGKKNFFSKEENYNVPTLPQNGPFRLSVVRKDPFFLAVLWLITCSIGLKAENYLLNCRVETISSPSSKAPKIFHTSPEHPNARIIITPPYGPAKGRPSTAPSSGDIFDPRLPSKPAARRPTVSSAISDDNILRRTSGRKRTVTEKYDDGSSDSDSLLEEGYTKPKKVKRENKEPGTTNSTPTESRRRKSSTKLLDSAESTPKTKKEGVGRPPSSSKSNREKEARLDRRENEELYEALQKQVTIDLLKRRSVTRTNSPLYI